MALRVGLTGGMGSGKTTVTALFETLGIPVYRADDAAKKLMNENEELKAAIIDHFGEAAYNNGILNRKHLAALVFNDAAQLAVLNGLVHPVTIRDGEDWMRRQTTAYAIKEAAIIFESGAHQHLDYIIGVYAPPAIRILRSMKRDLLTQEEVKDRMDRQMDDNIKMKLCDAVITNDEQSALIPQVIQLHEHLKSLNNLSAINRI